MQIPAEELKQQYSVFGHFYSIRLDPGEQIDCGSVLEIASGHFQSNDLLSDPVDAVFIMMNPGSSRPLGGEVQVVSADDISKINVSLVPAKPDTTQYQVMRLMHRFGWQHVRVLNLSDIRQPKSSQFFQMAQDLERMGFDGHSIFSGSRQGELKKTLHLKVKASVICAWGVSPMLTTLATQCIGRLSRNSAVIGLRKLDVALGFYHPLPTLQAAKEQWVCEMADQILRGPTHKTLVLQGFPRRPARKPSKEGSSREVPCAPRVSG